MRFILFVEGYTEEKAVASFLKKWLDAQLKKPVGVKPVLFEGCPELIKDAPKKAKMYLNGPKKSDIVAVISILDLQGIPNYPPEKKSVKQRYEWAKKYMEKKVNNERFHQFFAVHELEAWLLSQPEIFPNEIKPAITKITKNPETINFNNKPSGRLQKLYQQHLKRNYKKPINGKLLFSKLDPEIVYKKCPYFRLMLDELLKLAKATGQ